MARRGCEGWEIIKRRKRLESLPCWRCRTGPGYRHEYPNRELETLSGEVGVGARGVSVRSERVREERKGDVVRFETVRKRTQTRRPGVPASVVTAAAHVVAHGYWKRATGGGARARRETIRQDAHARVPDGVARERGSRLATSARRDVPGRARRRALEYEEDLDRTPRQVQAQGVPATSERFVSRRGRTGACFTDALAPKSSDAQRRAITGGRYFTLGGSLADDAIDVDGLGDRLRRNGVRSARVVRGAECTPRARRPFVKSSTR